MSCIFLKESPCTLFIASICAGKQTCCRNLTPTVFPVGDTDSLAFNRDSAGEKSDKGRDTEGVFLTADDFEVGYLKITHIWGGTDKNVE